MTTNQNIIAGIGSRKTPPKIFREMNDIGRWCRENKVWVRTGHAPGADMAFELGAKEYSLLYLPWNGFGGSMMCGPHVVVHETADLIEITHKYHPVPEALNSSGIKLMNRNACQVLGLNLNDPVKAVVCWTGDGLASGGTGQAMRIAADYKIPILNMQHEVWNSAIKVIEYLESIIKTS